MTDVLAPRLPDTDLTASVIDEIAAGAAERDAAAVPPFPRTRSWPWLAPD